MLLLHEEKWPCNFNMWLCIILVKKRHYHRNAAYEKELWRDENRKAFRNRHRVRPFTKKVNTKQETDSQITFSAKEDVQLTDLTEQVETNSPTADGDSSGTWEIKNTSTTLRNGKSKVVSMKILFKPQEQGRLRRKIRKRGKIRCSLQKNASATNKVISQYQQQFYHMAAYKEELYLPTEQVSYFESCKNVLLNKRKYQVFYKDS